MCLVKHGQQEACREEDSIETEGRANITKHAIRFA